MSQFVIDQLTNTKNLLDQRAEALKFQVQTQQDNLNAIQAELDATIQQSADLVQAIITLQKAK